MARLLSGGVFLLSLGVSERNYKLPYLIAYTLFIRICDLTLSLSSR